MNLEDYIKGLEPDLQEKARACGSADELLALAKEAKVPLPDEVLAAIAGGDDSDVGSCYHPKCPKCGSRNTEPCDKEGSEIIWDEETFRCKDCGCKFRAWV